MGKLTRQFKFVALFALSVFNLYISYMFFELLLYTFKYSLWGGLKGMCMFAAIAEVLIIAIVYRKEIMRKKG